MQSDRAPRLFQFFTAQFSIRKRRNHLCEVTGIENGVPFKLEFAYQKMRRRQKILAWGSRRRWKNLRAERSREKCHQ
jgi:hypothetical protein